MLMLHRDVTAWPCGYNIHQAVFDQHHYIVACTVAVLDIVITRSSPDAETRATRLEVNQGHQTVAFHMLGILSSCALITLSLRRVVFRIFDFKKSRDLDFLVRGHSRSLKVAPFDILCTVSY